MQNGKSLEDMLKEASKKLGTDPNNLKKAAANGKINNLLKNLGTKQAEKVSKILSDKNKTAELLSSPKAKELMKKFFGGK